jgi:hypothetical protein
MAYAPLRVKTSEPPTAGWQPEAIPVILDFGDQARVVTVRLSRTPQMGDRFEFQGCLWEIVRDRDLLRGYVARVVTPGICVH